MANPTLRAATVRAAAKRAERAARQPNEPEATPAPTPERQPNEPEATPAPTPERQPNEPEATPAPTPEPEPTTRTGSRPGRLGAVLAALVLLAVAATAALGWQYREAERTTQARTAALAAAHKAAPAILSYDYRHLDRDFAAARTHLTGPFLEEYDKTTKTVVAPTAKQYRGVVKATVATPTSVSVISASPHKAVILLFMNQLTTSTQVTTPRLDLNRVRMTLIHSPQGWKVSALDAL
ncbi:hypothetical protein [Streptomyces sp. NBC_01353]|uniref:hypothetical protein n=1 Tax=Streptomyces sp. NBC_01353 TaxID=2903835 RepID=UPI002E2F2C87|nr:hypothetical protein [Streptomyces sp. NBC_01353]